MIEIVKAGLIGGILMDLWAILAQSTGFTRMNMPLYRACLVSDTPVSMSAGLLSQLFHLIVSVVIAFGYSWIFTTFGIEPSITSGLFLGLLQALVAGMFLPQYDGLNACVRARKLLPLGRFGSGYGIDGIVTYIFGYLFYGASIGFILSIH